MPILNPQEGEAKKVASRTGLPRRVEDARLQRDTPPVVRMRATPRRAESAPPARRDPDPPFFVPKKRWSGGSPSGRARDWSRLSGAARNWAVLRVVEGQLRLFQIAGAKSGKYTIRSRRYRGFDSRTWPLAGIAEWGRSTADEDLIESIAHGRGRQLLLPPISPISTMQSVVPTTLAPPFGMTAAPSSVSASGACPRDAAGPDDRAACGLDRPSGTGRGVAAPAPPARRSRRGRSASSAA